MILNPLLLQSLMGSHTKDNREATKPVSKELQALREKIDRQKAAELINKKNKMEK